MQEVAEEWFREHPLCDFITVHEHAGWSLSFARESVECVGSANGEAQFRPDRPLPTAAHGRNLPYRRPVRRPDLREVTSLADYLTPAAGTPPTAALGFALALGALTPEPELQLA